MSHVLILIKAPPYGSELPFSGLKLANTILEEHPDRSVRIFLLSDAVNAAVAQQTPPEGWPNIGEMLADAIARGAEVKCCITCLKARGLAYTPLVPGAEAGTMSDLAAWTVGASQVVSL